MVVVQVQGPPESFTSAEMSVSLGVDFQQALLPALSLSHFLIYRNFPPSYVLTWLLLMPQLERLSIRICYFVRYDVERQLHQTPDTVTLPNLQRFEFHEGSTYLESLCARISAPSLNTLHVCRPYERSFTVPVPNLEEVGYSGGSDVRDAFTTFLNERQVPSACG
jgi:hypothetical protein